MNNQRLVGPVFLLLASAASGCSGDEHDVSTGRQPLAAAQGPGIEFPATEPQLLAAAQSRVLGFESPAIDWNSNNGSALTASAVVTQGSSSLSVLPNGYTELSSVGIEAPGSASTIATFDLRTPQALAWGEVRLVVKAPSKGLYWSDLGGKALAEVAPGEFGSVSFPIPQGVQDLTDPLVS